MTMDSTTTTNSPDKTLPPQSPFYKKHGQKLIALGPWLVILGSYWGYASWHNLSPLTTAQRLGHFLQNSNYGPFVFLAIFLVRPLILFPTAILTILAGFLFDPILGLGCALGGNLISAMVAYVVGHYLGQDLFVSGRNKGVVDRYAHYLRQNGFEAVLVMRLLLLNFDFVSYLAGLLRINWRAFFWATGLGSLAGVTSYVLAGASIEGDFTSESASLDPWMLGLSVVLFGASFFMAWYLRRRQKNHGYSDGVRDSGR